MGVNRPKTPAPVAAPPKTVPDDPNRHDAYGITKDNSAWLKNAPKQSQERVKNLWGRYGTPSQVDLERAYAAGNAVPTPPGAKSSDYWLDPYRIARYHNVLQNAPAGYKPPEWMDTEAIESAYKYLEYRNGGKPWYKWKALSDDDPAAEWLRSWKLPDPVDAPDREFKLLQPQESTAPYTFDDVEGTSGISDEDWAKLPYWQKIVIPFLSSGGWKAGAAMGLATAVPIGAVASIATANPIPLLAGAGVGAGLGALFGALGDKAPFLVKALSALDMPAEAVERTIGLGWQLGGAISDPDKYGSFMTVLNNLPAAWKAGTITEDVIPGAITGKAVYLGQAEPVQLDENMIGLAAIVGARSEMQAVMEGKSQDTFEDIANKYRDVLGFAGMGTDLIGHMALDPLNITGLGGKAAIKGLAKVSKNANLLDAVKMTGKSDGITRVLQAYKINLQALPDDEAVKLGKLDQWLAGIAKIEDNKPVYKRFDDTVSIYDKGAGKILRAVPVANIPWLLHLDPKSRALESVTSFLNNSKVLMSDAPDPVKTTNMYYALAKILPENASNVSLAGWTKGQDGALFPLVLKEAYPKLAEFLDNNWLLPADKRMLYTDIAKALNTDIYKLMKDLDSAKGTTHITWLKEGLNKIGTPEAKALIAKLDDPLEPITAGRIMADLKEYKAGNFALTAGEYNAKLFMLLDDLVSDWAVKYYKVQPTHLLGRMAGVIKSAQSLLLLGGNPNYMFNNLFDNVGAMTYAGVFKLQTRATRDNFWSRMGFEPMRRRSGVTAAEVENIGGKEYQAGRLVTQATKKGDALDWMDNKLHKVSDKIGLFTKGSAVIESESSDIAYTVAAMRLMRDNWKAGKGFKKLDAAIEAELRAIGVDPDDIYKAIESSLNETELNKNLFEGLKKYTVERVVSGEDADVLREAGILDFLNDKMVNAKNIDDVEKALTDTWAVLQKNMEQATADNLKYKQKHSFTKASIEGFQGAVEDFDTIALDRDNFWQKHISNMNEMWKTAGGIADKQKRRQYIKRKMAESMRDWNIFRQTETAKYLGVIEAVGGDQRAVDANTARFLNDAIGLSQTWDNYFNDKHKIMNLYYMAKYDGDHTALVEIASMLERILGPEVMRELDGLPTEVLDANLYSYVKRAMSKSYDDAMDLEMMFQTSMDDLFVELFETQFAGGKAAAAEWRKGVRDIRTMMSTAQRYFRDGKPITGLPDEQAQLLKGGIDNILHGNLLDDLQPEARDAAWIRFNEEIYRPLVNDLTLTNQRKAADMYRASVQVNAGVPLNNMPTPLNPKQKLDALRRIASKEYGIPSVSADGASLDNMLLNIINKYSGKAFASLDEIDLFTAREAFDGWGAEKAGLTPTEFALQRHNMSLTELQEYYRKNKAAQDQMGANRNLRQPKQVTEQPPAQASLFDNIDNTPPPPAVGQPLGTVDSLNPTPPIDEMQHQAWMDKIRPVMERMEAAFRASDSDAPTGIGEKLERLGRENGMTDDQINVLWRKLKAYSAETATSQKDLKYVANKWGESMRDHVLLNYARRTNFDNLMNLVFPYSFWATNAGQQWALRALDRPAMMANYARIKEFQQTTVDRPGFPTRLRNKIGINLPFLPDWMGETVFIDPIRRVFPFQQFFQPLDEIQEQNNLEYKKAISILQDMVNADEVSQADALQAYNTQTGELWQKVMTQAKAEIDGDIANPFDVISLMIGPSLPVQWAYKTIMGKQDQIGQLPLTRTVQNATVALGIGGPAGWNMEAPIRKALGLPEVDQFYDYRVDKALSDLTADGVIKPDDAVRAMIERKGEIYDKARERVAKEGLIKYMGAPLSLDFFPEGEQHQRALRDEYSKAIDAYANGDTEAINEFFEQYPEYDVQLQAWRDPEERLRRFLRSQIWESYNALEGPNKGVIRNRFGELFQDAFINKATRSYDSIDTQTLAMWAGALNNKVPESKEFIQPVTIEEMKPLISETIPGTEMYEPEQAQAVKEYWDEREKQFPGVLDLQTIYYGSSKADRRNLITIYPQLKKYWEWNKAYKANHPLVADYVEKQSAMYDQQDNMNTLQELDPIMLKALMQYTTGIPLGNGARTYLYQVWVDNGRPADTFEKYLDSLANILADY